MRKRIVADAPPTNGSGTESPPCLHELFGEQVGKTPQDIALVGAGEDGMTSKEMTYTELDDASDALAAELLGCGVGCDGAVGIHMERSPEYVVAMLAALKAGAAFLPLELAYPKEMLAEITADADVPVIFTKDRYAKNLPGEPEIITLDPGWRDALAGSNSLPEVSSSPDDLAFIAYSSGTTGLPKGIANPHRAAVGSYLWRFGVDAPGGGDRVGCNVFFIWEALRPLLRGAAVVVIPDDVIYAPQELVAFLHGNRITETLFTPSLLETVLNHYESRLHEELPHLKTLWLNGEVVTKHLAGRAIGSLPETRLLNVYSISEAHEVAAGDLRELRNISGSTYCAVGLPAVPEATRILGDDLEPLPTGEAGELYVAGDWLARGYVGLPDKTAERFPENPFPDVPGGRIYRTGDRAKMLPGGELEILGRADFMVKVRGYSIELGAVETALELSLPVKGCCVVADGEEGADKRLVAYLVPSNGDIKDISPGTGRSPELRERLKESLPHYAIPSVYVALDALPIQKTTGKVDRSKLPTPPERTASKPRVHLPENPSPDEEVRAVAAIFESVLGLDAGDVSEDEDFFAIGGHSLAAAEVLGLMEDIFGVMLPVSELLEAPTPTKLRKRLSNRSEGGVSGSVDLPESRRRAKRDSVPGDDISPAGTASRTRISESDGIFLTGATGFLGAYLLSDILDSTDAHVRCLVRDGGGSVAQIRANLGRYGLWRPEHAARLSAVAGDLGSPRFGLSDDDFYALSESCEVVLHAAASVNLVYPYDALKSANVEGTREVLRLCAAGETAKTLHFVSTNGIFPPGYGECREDIDTEHLIDGLTDGYGMTKWAAERLVAAARERGLPAFVYRPGNISGDMSGGAFNAKDLLCAAISASLRTGISPEFAAPSQVEMTPVDFVSRSILNVADAENPSAHTFHTADPNPPTTDDFFSRLGEAGHPTKPVGLGEWTAAVASSDRVPDLVKAIIGSGETLPHAFDAANRFTCDNLRSTSEELRPPLDDALLARYALALTEKNNAGGGNSV